MASRQIDRDELLRSERQLRAEGFCWIAGVDEAGRGPLAGPVVAAAVILPQSEMIAGINDSKRLSEKRREALYEEIIQKAVSFSIQSVDEEEIDRINILQATRLAMRRAVEALSPAPLLTLIDAVTLGGIGEERAIIKGDATSYHIAAASVLAKVWRDRYMVALHEQYPEYGFDKHKGYGTKAHMDALREFGPSPIHRKKFIRFLDEQ